ncbi:MAG TPA: GNAT family N-acetyltransferase [Clostridiales bacterium]|nr:GNAT family N-acetyltransferase [Clostridiales bacterium]
MFRKLRSSDKEKLFKYLEKERAYNLFIFGDVENYGMETDFQELWAEFEDDEYIAVLLRYKNFCILYSDGNFNVKWFADKIRSYKGIEGVSGKREIIEALSILLDYKKIRHQYLSELEGLEDIPEEFLKQEVSLAVPDDAVDLYELESKIKEFEDFSNSIEKIEEALRSGRSKTYFIGDGGKIVSCASTTAETSSSVMVIGVCTHPDFRGKGYASFCTARLSYEFLKAGKRPCLFYDNPAAGKIYRRIGYKDIGKWDLIVL